MLILILPLVVAPMLIVAAVDVYTASGEGDKASSRYLANLSDHL